MSDIDVQAVPTLGWLRHYLDYQYPMTRGDIQLTKLCNRISELERELNEAKAELEKRHNAFKNFSRERDVGGKCQCAYCRRDFEAIAEHAAIMEMDCFLPGGWKDRAEKSEAQLNEAIRQRNLYLKDRNIVMAQRDEALADKRRLDWLLEWNVEGHPFKTRESLDSAMKGQG